MREDGWDQNSKTSEILQLPALSSGLMNVGPTHSGKILKSLLTPLQIIIINGATYIYNEDIPNAKPDSHHKGDLLHSSFLGEGGHKLFK